MSQTPDAVRPPLTLSLILRRLAGKIFRAACAALGVTALSADASAQTFSYTGSAQSFLVPTTGLYEITAFGAQGGSGGLAPGGGLTSGGLGAKVGGTFSLTAGDVLNIYVGGQGGAATLGSYAYGGGGGGGTFVYNTTTSALILAAGGGGGGYTGNGGSGLATTGGTGLGGVGTTPLGGGGGGFNGAGSPLLAGGGGFSSLGGGARQFPSAGIGGFGGGGAGGGYGGGGGGGFTGGDAAAPGGFGGTSYFAAGGLNTFGISGFQAGNGAASINFNPVPEPTTIGLTGLLAVGYAIRRRGFAAPAKA